MTFAALARQARHTHSLATLAGTTIALAGILAVSITNAQLAPIPTAHANQGLYYQRGYYLDDGWLCYGWSNGIYHCTQHWHRAPNGQLVSDNPAWVPTYGGSGSAPATHASTPASGHAQAISSAGEPCRSTAYFAGTPSQWQVPPGCYAGIYAVNPHNYVYRSGFGWCSWWPAVMNPSRPNLYWGNYSRGSVPRPGATVVFAPGVQGASSDGHFARVIAVYPGGYWFLVSEMNFYWRGGGFGKVSYRYVHSGTGVTFIY